jgi:hypothetical protein
MMKKAIKVQTIDNQFLLSHLRLLTKPTAINKQILHGPVEHRNFMRKQQTRISRISNNQTSQSNLLPTLPSRKEHHHPTPQQRGDCMSDIDKTL